MMLGQQYFDEAFASRTHFSPVDNNMMLRNPVGVRDRNKIHRSFSANFNFKVFSVYFRARLTAYNAHRLQ